jgi:hypothetical protein
MDRTAGERGRNFIERATDVCGELGDRVARRIAAQVAVKWVEDDARSIAERRHLHMHVGGNQKIPILLVVAIIRARDMYAVAAEGARQIAT